MPSAEEIQALAEAAAQGNTGAGAADHTGAGDDKNKTVPITALHDERSKRQTLEAKLKQMETVFGEQISYDSQGNLIPRQVAPVQQPQQTPDMDIRKQLDHLWENDPRRAVQTELTQALNWYDGLQVSLQEQMDAVSVKVKDFDAYRPKVQAYLRKLPLDQRSRPGIVEAAYFLQKGFGVDALLEQERQNIQRSINAGDSAAGLYGGGAGTGGAGNSGGARRYSQEEISIAKMYNMTPEDYFKGSK